MWYSVPSLLDHEPSEGIAQTFFLFCRLPAQPGGIYAAQRYIWINRYLHIRYFICLKEEKTYMKYIFWWNYYFCFSFQKFPLQILESYSPNLFFTLPSPNTKSHVIPKEEAHLDSPSGITIFNSQLPSTLGLIIVFIVAQFGAILGQVGANSNGDLSSEQAALCLCLF